VKPHDTNERSERCVRCGFEFVHEDDVEHVAAAAWRNLVVLPAAAEGRGTDVVRQALDYRKDEECREYAHEARAACAEFGIEIADDLSSGIRSSRSHETTRTSTSPCARSPATIRVLVAKRMSGTKRGCTSRLRRFESPAALTLWPRSGRGSPRNGADAAAPGESRLIRLSAHEGGCP
jgi:hypothetical protein